MGVFQFEGGPMRALMRNLKPERFEHLVALNALYRPGPLGAGMHLEYADRKNGRSPVEYLHPDLEPILDDTFGIMVFQEQVMQAAQKMAGLLHGGGRCPAQGDGQEDPRRSCSSRRRSSSQAAVPRDTPASSARSCSGSSPTSPDTASTSPTLRRTGSWPTRRRGSRPTIPAEYMAALLTASKRDKDRTALYLHECRTMGIRVLVPDVNRSESDFAAVDGEITFGTLGGAQRGRGRRRAHRCRAGEERPVCGLPGTSSIESI